MVKHPNTLSILRYCSNNSLPMPLLRGNILMININKYSTLVIIDTLALIVQQTSQSHVLSFIIQASVQRQFTVQSESLPWYESVYQGCIMCDRGWHEGGKICICICVCIWFALHKCCSKTVTDWKTCIIPCISLFLYLDTYREQSGSCGSSMCSSIMQWGQGICVQILALPVSIRCHCR